VQYRLPDSHPRRRAGSGSAADLDLMAASVHNAPWYATYRREGGAQASWSQHGVPAAFERFVGLVLNGGQPGLHIDIGCGNGVKTREFARAGLPTLGVDLAFDGVHAAQPHHLTGPLPRQLEFIQANGLRLPFADDTFASASDILSLTHIPSARQAQYVDEMHRVLQSGGRALVVLFSMADEHFHGHAVSREYVFEFNSAIPLMAGYAHYQGKVNVHFDRREIIGALGGRFVIEEADEVRHPVYAHRRLWEVIVRKP
jgi:ubiquinone/menaquinone biosynthesis C-methylase UbiE